MWRQASQTPVTEKYLDGRRGRPRASDSSGAGWSHRTAMRARSRWSHGGKSLLFPRRRDDGTFHHRRARVDVDKSAGQIIVLPQRSTPWPGVRHGWSQIVRIGPKCLRSVRLLHPVLSPLAARTSIEPHRAMRGLGFNLVGQADVAGTVFCCECNLCSLYACRRTSTPKNVCTEKQASAFGGR